MGFLESPHSFGSSMFWNITFLVTRMKLFVQTQMWYGNSNAIFLLKNILTAHGFHLHFLYWSMPMILQDTLVENWWIVVSSSNAVRKIQEVKP